MSSPFDDCPIADGVRGRPVVAAGGPDPVVTIGPDGSTQLFFPDWSSVDWARTVVAALGLTGRITVHHVSAMPAVDGAAPGGRGSQAGDVHSTSSQPRAA